VHERICGGWRPAIRGAVRPTSLLRPRADADRILIGTTTATKKAEKRGGAGVRARRRMQSPTPLRRRIMDRLGRGTLHFRNPSSRSRQGAQAANLRRVSRNEEGREALGVPARRRIGSGHRRHAVRRLAGPSRKIMRFFEVRFRL